MFTDQSSVISAVISIGVGIWILADFRRLTKKLVKTQERYMNQSKPLSEFKIKAYRVYVLATGLIFAGIGIFVLIRGMLG